MEALKDWIDPEEAATLRAELAAAKEEIVQLDLRSGKKLVELVEQVATRDLVIKQMHDMLSGTVDEVWKSCSHQHASEFSEKLRRINPSTEALDAYVKQAVETEREECVKLCSSIIDRRRARGNTIGYNAIIECSEAIRARKELP